MTPDHDFREYRGRRVTVMGLGSFGGGVGAVQFLAERGAVVTVTDLRPEHQLAEAIAELRSAPPARWRLGGHDAADFPVRESGSAATSGAVCCRWSIRFRPMISSCWN